MFYKPVNVLAVKPDMGTKDGGTTIQVWGEGFITEWGAEATCCFGVRCSPATVHDRGYLTCMARGSDVVDRPMPFSVSMNGQQ